MSSGRPLVHFDQLSLRRKCAQLHKQAAKFLDPLNIRTSVHSQLPVTIHLQSDSTDDKTTGIVHLKSSKSIQRFDSSQKSDLRSVSSSSSDGSDKSDDKLAGSSFDSYVCGLSLNHRVPTCYPGSLLNPRIVSAGNRQHSNYASSDVKDMEQDKIMSHSLDLAVDEHHEARHEPLTTQLVEHKSKAELSDSEDEEPVPNFRGTSEHVRLRNGRKKMRNPVTANLTGTRYEVVRDMVEYVGFIVSADDDQQSFLFWTDPMPSNERISELKPYQRINHFPGMGEICRKDSLARNMARMARVFPLEYNFVPKTWVLPSEYAAFQSYNREVRKSKKRARTFIMKPANGAMGNGIQLIQAAERVPSNEHIIIQEYIDRPFLVDGFKCDLRIYVLVTSCDPLRIFLFNDGLLRLTTEKYVHPSDNNMDHLYMHLTNYSINKHNENYKRGESGVSGSKRSLRYFNEFLRRSDQDVNQIWSAIIDLIIKTMIIAHPHVFHAYRMCRPGQPPGSESVCFEILGFDIMLDSKLRPWLLEVNRSPSFATDQQLDYDVKSAVIEDALRLLNIKVRDKMKNLAEEKAQAQRRLLRAARRHEKSEREQHRQSLERRKEELNTLLTRIQKDEDREEHENRHCGRYRRIFPPIDRLTRIRYANLLSNAYRIFLSGHQAQSLDLEIQRLYSSDLKEYEVRELLAQCEADELDERKCPPPLHSLPSPLGANVVESQQPKMQKRPATRWRSSDHLLSERCMISRVR